MSANIFGDDEDDFVLPPGSDGSSSGKSTPPVKNSIPRPGGGTSSLPRRTPPATGNAPKLPGAPRPALPATRKQGLPPRQTTPVPAADKGSGSVPAKPSANKLPPRRPITGTSLPQKAAPVPVPTPAPEPVYEPEPTPAPETYTPEPVRVEEPAQDLYQDYAPQLSYNPPPVEPEDYRDHGYAEQAFPRQRIDDIRKEAQTGRSRDGDGPRTELDEFTANRRSFNEAFEDTGNRKVPLSEETEPKKRKKKTPAQVKKESQKGKAKKPAKYGGARKGVLVVRITAGALVLGLMGQGVNSLVNPPQFPSQTQFMEVVNKNLGVTEFPIDNGNAFVTSFVKEYMNFSPENSTNRRDKLREYTTDNIVSTLSSGNANTTQKISEGPIIVGTEAKDDSNAVYTVTVKVGENWVYMQVPVYYDSDSLAFVISGTPSFIAPPTKATPPKYERGFEIDAKLATEITPNVSSFLTAWGESDTEGISRYTTSDADTETKVGLQGTALFSKLDKLEVEAKREDDPSANTRKATAVVTWSSPVDTNITFTQNYDLTLFQQPDKRWYVADISGGVPQK